MPAAAATTVCAGCEPEGRAEWGPPMMRLKMRMTMRRILSWWSVEQAADDHPLCPGSDISQTYYSNHTLWHVTTTTLITTMTCFTCTTNLQLRHTSNMLQWYISHKFKTVTHFTQVTTHISNVSLWKHFMLHQWHIPSMLQWWHTCYNYNILHVTMTHFTYFNDTLHTCCHNITSHATTKTHDTTVTNSTQYNKDTLHTQVYSCQNQ